MAHGLLTRMTEGRITNVVGQASGLYNVAQIRRNDAVRQTLLGQQVFSNAYCKRSAYACDFQAMCQTVMNMVVCRKRVHLSFSCKTSECSGENNLVMVRI